MSCPICEKEPDQKYRPFCSRRCADIDLGKWMTGQYAVPSQQDDEDGELEQALAAEQNERDKPLH